MDLGEPGQIVMFVEGREIHVVDLHSMPVLSIRLGRTRCSGNAVNPANEQFLERNIIWRGYFVAGGCGGWFGSCTRVVDWFELKRFLVRSRHVSRKLYDVDQIAKQYPFFFEGCMEFRTLTRSTTQHNVNPLQRKNGSYVKIGRRPGNLPTNTHHQKLFLP